MALSNSSQNLRRKSWTLPWLILRQVKAGNIRQITIARKFGIDKRKVNYYVKNLVNMACIGMEGKALYMTQAGLEMLDRLESEYSNPRIRLENVRFKYHLVEQPRNKPDFKEVKLKNWKQYIGKVDNITVRINPDSLELIPSAVEGDHPYELYYIAHYDCDQVILNICEQWKMKVGNAVVSSRPEWAVYDPVARLFTKYNGQLRLECVGKINASAPNHVGELEFFDPLAVADYLEMPQNVHDIKQMVQRLLDAFVPKEPDSGKPPGDFIQ